MFDHVGIQVTDVSASTAALAAAFHPIGLVECRRFDTPGGPVVAFADASAPERPYFWLSGGTATEPRHESHIAFVAGSRAEVDEVMGLASGTPGGDGHSVLPGPRRQQLRGRQSPTGVGGGHLAAPTTPNSLLGGSELRRLRDQRQHVVGRNDLVVLVREHRVPVHLAVFVGLARNDLLRGESDPDPVAR